LTGVTPVLLYRDWIVQTARKFNSPVGPWPAQLSAAAAQIWATVFDEEKPRLLKARFSALKLMNRRPSGTRLENSGRST